MIYLTMDFSLFLLHSNVFSTYLALLVTTHRCNGFVDRRSVLVVCRKPDIELHQLQSHYDDRMLYKKGHSLPMKPNREWLLDREKT